MATQQNHAPSRQIAEDLVETLFPGGNTLAAPDKQQLLATVDSYLKRSRLLRGGLDGLLWWLEARCLITTGRRFTRATPQQRRQLLKKMAPSLIDGGLLQALSTPFKTAFLLDKKNLDIVNCHNGVDAPAAVEQHRWQQNISAAGDLGEDQVLEADAVVVGTGAGGAAAAAELASRGLAVVIIEEGKYYDRRDFSGRPTEVVPKLYRGLGATMAVGNTIIPIPIGRSVGGSTTINSGTCMRTPNKVLADWRERGLTEFTPKALEPYFQQVEDIIHVEEADLKFVGEIGNTIKKGANALGMTQAGPLHRNAKGCDGQGLCQFGCPSDAKQSTNVSFVPRAMERGAFLFTGFRATTLLRHGKRVNGVVAEGIGSHGKRVRLTVRARTTIIAMGSFLTPLFLRKNGIKSPHLGNNLTIHPAGGVVAWYPDKDFRNSRSIPQGYGISDLMGEGLMFEGGTAPFLLHGLLNPYAADDYISFTERYQQLAYFGFMIKETSRGKVRQGLHRDLPLITYNMNQTDFRLFLRGIEILVRIHLKAGAREVYIPGLRNMSTVRDERELAEFMKRRLGPRDFMITAYHPLGTARIGTNPGQGVCDTSHKVFGRTGLYIMDGSSVPGPLCANPQVTIMAMAGRAARQLADNLL